ncbi:Extradiol ring-cleavage dioxygenase, class III enzyme, subunit B [Mycena albidolilacea]|uniref:Extradiol ring-cleavage dioxygenase, class III enzyme, subunit B n=1 Tax=Mycena albidolilacea TaxID=1033008 RepID=A0AAD7A4K3_9AGAR|nr:Extradiol ring-cleavage dioxygenase, class III enzyme, subunit B [Mycena albidolilacea]
MRTPRLILATTLFLLSVISALYLSPSTVRGKIPSLISGLSRFLRTSATPSTASASNMTDVKPFQEAWRRNLDELPSTPEKIPAFFFGHGSPALAFPPDGDIARPGGLMSWGGPGGPLAAFLKDFGPALLKKYQPKGIVVFSAHWETATERLVTDYGNENPLLMDYYGFPPELYALKFKSKGDSTLAKRIVELYKEAGQTARLSPKTENRGSDGRGFQAPGLDHGVFVPFRLMFGDEFTDIPIVQVSIDSSLSPEKNWALGKAVTKLREEGILVLSGGYIVHNLRDREAFSPVTAKPAHKEFDQAMVASCRVTDATERKKALFDLTKHHGFRACHPREEHFVPLYVAAGAGEEGETRVITDIYASATVAFGL